MNPSLQLDLEKALKAYILAQNIFVPALTIHAAHETDKELTGTFLLIIAEPPNWEEMVINAIVPVRFELATTVKDPGLRVDATGNHSVRLGKIVELFSDQKYAQVITDLNAPAVPPDNRPWKGLGFTGWEAQKSEPDGTSETQIVSKLPYEFEVFLEN